jgi:PAS domain S-box-containing protein
MRIAPVLDSKGETTGYIAIKRDVTERRAAEEAQGFLAAIVESSDDGIIAFTPEGVILTWNRAAETGLGYSAGEAVGRHLSLMLPPERVSFLPQFIERVLGIPLTHQIAVTRPWRSGPLR